MTVDLANPDMTDLDGGALHRERIYINRRQFVWENAYNELVLVRNFDVEPHVITLSLRFAADFVDVFEVRGQHRAKRGRRSAERLSDEAVVLRTMRLGEADRIVNMITLGHGKVRAVVKGVRKTKSRFGGRLEPNRSLRRQASDQRRKLQRPGAVGWRSPACDQI